MVYLLCPVFGHQCADPGAANRHQCDAAAALEYFRKNQDTARAAFIANQTAKSEFLVYLGKEGAKGRPAQLTLCGGDRVAYIGGVRYQDKNHAGQINAGLAVINALCAFHGVTAPIIVDNAESVNDFIPVKSQLVRLVVTTGEFQVTNH